MNQHSPSQQLIETTCPSGFALTLMDEHHEFKSKRLIWRSSHCFAEEPWNGKEE